jgi:primosomal protein N' (replication factor Y) (superfamily II helicase)
MSDLVVSVAVPRPVRRLFSYSVPPGLAPRARRGVRVVVPFGRGKETAYLIDREAATDPSAIPLKPIEAILDPEPVLDEAVLELTRWAAEYYVASWGEMIRCALPGMKATLHTVVGISSEGRRALQGMGGVLSDASLPAVAREPEARVILGLLAQFCGERTASMRLADLKRRAGPRFKVSVLTRLQRAGLIDTARIATGSGPRARLEEHAVLLHPEAAPPAGARRRRLLDALRSATGRVPVPQLLRLARSDRAALRALQEAGLVRIDREEVARRPPSLELPPGAPAERPEPTPDQSRAIEAIGALLAQRRFATCLLHGVTGSGKTEVYLRSIEATIAAGRRAIYLVPEIGLTPLLARRLRGRFGEVLALLHSGLSEGERYDEWRRIREGRVRVVLGARSAVFAPLPELGLIVVDEEHDASYKQGETPRYNGRDLAVMRGKMAEAVVVLGSATPSVESYWRASRGRHRLLTLPRRIGTAGLPPVERVDMRHEFQEVGRESILSRRLLAALGERLQRREQSLVLLNRRGFSTFVLCRACGEQLTCRRCSITLTLHLRERRLRCHYCDDHRAVPAACPACGAGPLHFGGTGTERLEEVLRGHFPEARIERMDRDTVRGRGAVEDILTRVERGSIDILLGTQMIAKGHDFPNVTLVGVLAADALLGLPDFRAGERTFQLLAQVAGRSGRGSQQGQVIVQAYDADHHAVRAACEHDFDAFARRELAFRRAMNYPPYSALALLLLKDRVQDRARAAAGTVAQVLRRLQGRSLTVLGPAPAPLERLRGVYRVQVLVKAHNRRAMQETLAEMLREMDRLQVRLPDLTIDVDPMSTL